MRLSLEANAISAHFMMSAHICHHCNIQAQSIGLHVVMSAAHAPIPIAWIDDDDQQRIASLINTSYLSILKGWHAAGICLMLADCAAKGTLNGMACLQ